MSPTAPTFATLNDELIKAHRRIRELQARATEILAQNRTLCAVVTELIHDDGGIRHFGIGQKVVDERRLSGAEEAGQDSDRDRFRNRHVAFQHSAQDAKRLPLQLEHSVRFHQSGDMNTLTLQ